MLVPTLVAILVLLCPLTYLALRRLCLVEQEITFDVPQRGVCGLSLVIHDDTVHRLRIHYADGRMYEVSPETCDGPAASRASGRWRDRTRKARPGGG